MSWLNCLSIYEDAINNGIDTAEEALRQLELEHCIKELHRSAEESLKESGSWEHITNSIIDAYFYNAKEIIERETADSVDIDYYVNCNDSHFYIGDDEVY